MLCNYMLVFSYVSLTSVKSRSVTTGPYSCYDLRLTITFKHTRLCERRAPVNTTGHRFVAHLRYEGYDVVLLVFDGVWRELLSAGPSDAHQTSPVISVTETRRKQPLETSDKEPGRQSGH